ncbi:MAG TPA: DoxX family protein [Opitutaceae bacterium]|nr:DoxX family protein [Opitutaceae bacterium]
MNFRTLYSRFAAAAGCLQSVVLLFIRLAWGFQLLESGWGHLTHVGKTAQFFASLHIPFPTANVYISGTTELVGGALLMLGLFARGISIPLIFNFCVAYATDASSSIKELLQLSPDDFINYTAFPFLVTSLLILAFGPGKISIDFLVEKFAGKKSGASATRSEA